MLPRDVQPPEHDSKVRNGQRHVGEDRALTGRCTSSRDTQRTEGRPAAMGPTCRFLSGSPKVNPKKTGFSEERYLDRRRRGGPWSQDALCTERDLYRRASVVI